MTLNKTYLGLKSGLCVCTCNVCTPTDGMQSLQGVLVYVTGYDGIRWHTVCDKG